MKFSQNLTLIVFVFLGLQVSYSQSSDNMPESVKKIAKIGVKNWQNSLILTTKQAEKLFDITTVYEMSKLKIYKSSSLTIEDKNSKLKELETSHYKKVEGLLTDKQIEKFKSKVKMIKG